MYLCAWERSDLGSNATSQKALMVSWGGSWAPVLRSGRTAHIAHSHPHPTNPPAQLKIMSCSLPCSQECWAALARRWGGSRGHLASQYSSPSFSKESPLLPGGTAAIVQPRGQKPHIKSKDRGTGACDILVLYTSSGLFAMQQRNSYLVKPSCTVHSEVTSGSVAASSLLWSVNSSHLLP
jgi:hypothetical protein